MSLFGNLQNFIDKAQNTATAIKKTVIPVEIENLKKSHDRIAEELSLLEQGGIAPDSPQSLTKITHLRTFLMTHFGHLVRGGEPEPVPGGKMHPLYIEVKNGYGDLEQRLSALEQKYQNCQFGYQTPDGQILKPSLDWTEEQWNQIRASSKDQLARCWLLSDKNQYC